MSDNPVVYFTREISPEGLQRVYDALGRTPHGKVAVKVSSGEPGNKHYLKAALVGDFVKSIQGEIVECNTAYDGGRNETTKHYQVLQDHGFASFAKTIILDGEDEISLPVRDGKHLTENVVGALFKDYDFHVILSHFKGHIMGGFGGALKNMAIGYASSRGKLIIHGAGDEKKGFDGDQDSFLESMAEAVSTILETAGKENFLYINVMNDISVDCDCDGNAAPPDMEDIGILASLDPVALDQACVDLVFNAEDGKNVVERIESRHGQVTLRRAVELGLGSREYTIEEI